MLTEILQKLNINNKPLPILPSPEDEIVSDSELYTVSDESSGKMIANLNLFFFNQYITKQW